MVSATRGGGLYLCGIHRALCVEAAFVVGILRARAYNQTCLHQGNVAPFYAEI